MNDLITIIIPIYNVVAYFDRCIQSIMQQTYYNLEIIIIDDGSNDGSENKCDKYATMDSRIKVIHKENTGQADSRNVGIEEANGKFIAFVDADDFVSKDYIKYLYDLLIENNADISNCSFKRVWNHDKVKISKNKSQKKIFTSEEAIENLCYMKDLIFGPYCKLYKKEVWDGIRFPVGYIYEDLAIMYKVFSQAKVIVFESSKKYFYSQRPGSTLCSDFKVEKLSRIKFADEIVDYISRYYPNILNSAICRKFWSNAGALMDLPWSSNFKQYYQIIKQNIKSSRGIVLTDSKSKLSIRIMAACSFLGIIPLKALGSFYNKVLK